MEVIFDIALLLSESGFVRQVEFGSKLGENSEIRTACKGLIGQKLSEVSSMVFQEGTGEVQWLERRFTYLLFECFMEFVYCFGKNPSGKNSWKQFLTDLPMSFSYMPKMEPFNFQ